MAFSKAELQGGFQKEFAAALSANRQLSGRQNPFFTFLFTAVLVVLLNVSDYK
ncbi:hypothetical protein BBR47_11090 [Brevibacillus brevis NBRC 100599]|uniref:Uncharacterized protein n=1 Tax=Brevibacillus brevis (strain 47 / JCM 6285 / NBRC 100599) TaxID=358681 RepID=C0Z6C9_BREBN|nr:hypothetical protein BBR47_11090 [Brevibacillus brevis NBRC 100599]